MKHTASGWRSLRLRPSTKWRNLNIFFQVRPGNDYIIYSICELLRSEELLNQPALHTFNYHLRGELGQRGGKSEDLQYFSLYNCGYNIIMISTSAPDPSWTDIFRLKSVGETGESDLLISIEVLDGPGQCMNVCVVILSGAVRWDQVLNNVTNTWYFISTSPHQWTRK